MGDVRFEFSATLGRELTRYCGEFVRYYAGDRFCGVALVAVGRELRKRVEIKAREGGRGYLYDLDSIGAPWERSWKGC